MQPELEDCCHSGCTQCVFDLYDEALERYEIARDVWRKRQVEKQAGKQPEKQSRQRKQKLDREPEPESQPPFQSQSKSEPQSKPKPKPQRAKASSSTPRTLR
ncbi:oxidoreductase-like domain-containing protein [Paraburkholderia antibiotica]|uniref:oxidoreductase-like domain-containing protein n=1 Tax=Paraburkholderia antibiotica TaxID=2728839 RepID=UPI002E3336F2|nr:oxidoreductase-like domain-containing protein [Paraburkholderia antibiotica]